MKTNSSKLLFIMSFSLGVIMSISSNNWIMIWCGLEISLVSIMPLMICKMLISAESTMKYFIVQSISSSMLMLSMMIMIMKGDYNYNYVLTTSLMIKMGISPFHNWVLTVVEGLEYPLVFTLLTLNKIAPITLMSYTSLNINWAIIMTIMFGSILALNQNSIKKLIGYSSIFNMGFIMAIMKQVILWMMYLLVYSIMMIMLISILMYSKINFINQMMFMDMMSKKMSLWINVLSMGGMPPLIGFSIKYMVISQMILMKSMVMISIMVMMSLLVMFFYLRMTFVSLMNSSVLNKTKMFNLNEMTMITILINTFLMPIMLMVKT